jgi:hypothetical protein
MQGLSTLWGVNVRVKLGACLLAGTGAVGLIGGGQAQSSLDELIQTGVTDWGPSAVGARIISESQTDGWAVAWASSNETDDRGWDCKVTVRESFWSANPTMRQNIVNHEIGHCLGLEHPGIVEDSIMSRPELGITDLDRVKVRQVRPWPWRVTVGVAGDGP